MLSLALVGLFVGSEIVVASEALDPKFAPTNVQTFARRVEEVGGFRKGTFSGKAFSRPRDALAYIREHKVPFAILPVHQFVEGRKELGLEVLGRAVGPEGKQIAYWGVTRNEPRTYANVENRAGLRLATTETYDLQWLKVLFEANVNVREHFQLVEVSTAEETVSTVLAKKADLALVHERDFQPLKARIENKTDLAWVYTSGGMPPPPVVATKWASKNDRKRMAQTLDKLCKGDGAPACGRMVILYFEAGRAETYGPIIQKYDTY